MSVPMYKLTREFSFEYAHRLNMDYQSPCKGLHGHSARIIVSIMARKIDKNGMVVDFTKLKPIQAFLDEKFDHALILNSEDPLMDVIRRINDADLSKVKPSAAKDLLEATLNALVGNKICVIGGDPTSEVLAGIIWEGCVEVLQRTGIEWSSMEITFYETAKNCASFSAKNPMLPEGID